MVRPWEKNIVKGRKDLKRALTRYTTAKRQLIESGAPKIIVRDSAVDALCHGANLAVPGVLSIETGIKPSDTTAILTQKGEAIAIAKALKTTEEITKISHGLIAKTQSVLMPRGLYPKLWRTSK